MVIQNLKESVNHTLGFLPFLWFFELFINACFRITYLTFDKQISFDVRLIIFYLFEFLIICFMDFAYVLCVHYFQSHRPTVNQLYFQLLNIKVNFCFTNRKVNSEIFRPLLLTEYTALNVFTIHIRFIFGFLSSVLTFTVMFIQLLALS